MVTGAPCARSRPGTQKRSRLEYLLHLLDDEYLEQARLVLTGQYAQRANPLALTRRLVIVITIGMAAASTVSLMAVQIMPGALLMIPVYFCVLCSGRDRPSENKISSGMIIWGNLHPISV